MKIFRTILLLLITLALPFVLMMTSIRLLLHPAFLDFEYNQANFPADEFGFTKTDRLHWGKLSLEYLVNDQGIDFLANLKFDDGTGIYNERELSHMLDVKNLIQAALLGWYIALAFIVLVGIWAWRGKWLGQFWRALSNGGFLTIAVIVAVLLGVAINFDALFRGFHAIFFTGDTWLFYIDDTLIRLFPEKLWSDAFTFMGVFTILGALVFGFGGNRLARKA
ncbi:MAG: TIGR01906 family membrane protein [Anaerolineaceae bacterium]|nr:TIGR01906 family membrane protein [Anaerolineaceae bacterium]